MVVVAIVAILLSVPIAAVECFAFYMPILLVLILVPAAVAPSGRRIEAGYWAMAIHPLLLLVGLAAWRAFWPQSLLYPKDRTLFNTTPYFMAYLSRFYLPIFAILGLALAAYRSSRRSVFISLLVLPITWITTLIVLTWNPFDLFDLFWD